MYEEALRTITKSLKNTVGKRRVRTDKTGKTNNEEIKETREARKKLRKTFQEACRTGTEEEKLTTKNKILRKLNQTAHKNWKGRGHENIKIS